MGSEDFGEFVNGESGVPGYYFLIGGTPPEAFEAAAKGGPQIPGQHSPVFQIAPRESVTTGTAATLAAIFELAPRR